MTRTQTMRRGGLDWNLPREGIASTAYEVALTSEVLKSHAKQARGWGEAARHATRLHVISGLLHRIAERQCNEDLTCPECRGEGYFGQGLPAAQQRGCRACAGHGQTVGRRLESLRQDAREIAGHYGLTVYFQTDPRGCSLYLIDPAIVPQYWAAVPGNALDAYVWDREAKDGPPSLSTLQARWIEANYNRGHAVVRLGR